MTNPTQYDARCIGRKLGIKIAHEVIEANGCTGFKMCRLLPPACESLTDRGIEQGSQLWTIAEDAAKCAFNEIMGVE